MNKIQDSVSRRINEMKARTSSMKAENLYFYNQPVTEMLGGSKVRVDGRVMSMYASYSYLGLIGHPRINKAAQEAIARYGTGTHGVRTLAGTLPIHVELEETIANFKHSEDAITYSSGYVTNLSVISTLVGRGDYVFCDKLNHASIYDGCMMSHAKFVRFNHNDLRDLGKQLSETPVDSAKLVVVDAVFSMDGDLVNLPELRAICDKYQSWLMVDEAHSVGVLGETGRGIEEHFKMVDAIDIKMGTLSKTIPSIGGYVASTHDVINYLRHASRGYIFSAALPPAQAAASNEAFKVILDEQWRVTKLCDNANRFITGLGIAGFNTFKTQTAIVPIYCGSDQMAYEMTREAQMHDIFVLPVVSPAVPEGQARLRATVTANHTSEDIIQTVEVLTEAGIKLGLI
jgi:8-amino-7-oxononanoate synthase